MLYRIFPVPRPHLRQPSVTPFHAGEAGRRPGRGGGAGAPPAGGAGAVRRAVPEAEGAGGAAPADRAGLWVGGLAEYTARATCPGGRGRWWGIWPKTFEVSAKAPEAQKTPFWALFGPQPGRR